MILKVYPKLVAICFNTDFFVERFVERSAKLYIWYTLDGKKRTSEASKKPLRLPLPRILSPMYRNPCIVGATGFEPATSASRTQRSTKLSHAPFQLPNYSNTFSGVCLVNFFNLWYNTKKRMEKNNETYCFDYRCIPWNRCSPGMSICR